MYKPHRFILDRVSGYAGEAAAYLRRRRATRRPFARVYWRGGRGAAYDASSEQGRRLFLAAAHLLDLTRTESRR
jgi:hypothetical protein